MISRFQRTIENFICLHCGAEVRGNGYTNHCPRCLWSKHVDVNPGDRAASCDGLMEAIAVEGASPTYSIVHKCIRCGFERKNKVEVEDNIEALLAIARHTN